MSRRNAQRALAVVSCLVLLYFAVGTFVHKHKSESEATCSICQALQMRAITGAPVGLIAEPQLISWQDSLSPHCASTDSFHLRAASRAPPA